MGRLTLLLLFIKLCKSEINEYGIKIDNSEHSAYFISDEIDRVIKLDASAPLIKFEESHSDCTATRKNITVLYLNEINKLYSEWLNIEHVQIEDLDNRYLLDGNLNLLQNEKLVNISRLYFLKNSENCVNSQCKNRTNQESILNKLAQKNGYSPIESECAPESETSLEYTVETSERADSILLDVKSLNNNNLRITADKQFKANFILERNGHAYYHINLPESFQKASITFDIQSGDSDGHANLHECRSFKIYNIEAVQNTRSLSRRPRGVISSILAISALSSEFFAYQKLSGKISNIEKSIVENEKTINEVSKEIFANSLSLSELMLKECQLEKTLSEEKLKNVIFNSFLQYREELSDLLLSIQTKTPGNVAHRLLVDLCSEDNSDLNACKLFFHEQNYNLINISAIKKDNTIKISLWIHYTMPILSKINSVKTIKSLPVPFSKTENLYEYREAIIPKTIGTFQNYTFALDNCNKNHKTIFCKFEDLNLNDKNTKCLITIKNNLSDSNDCFKIIKNPETCLFKISDKKVYISHFVKPKITSLKSKPYPSSTKSNSITEIGITELMREKQKLLITCGEQQLTFLGLKRDETEIAINIDPVFIHTNLSLNISHSNQIPINKVNIYHYSTFVPLIIIFMCLTILAVPVTLILIYKSKCSHRRIAKSTIKALEARRPSNNNTSSFKLKNYFNRNKVNDNTISNNDSKTIDK